MKNKKGFTLVELLAVIVILAVVAIIAVPIILNVIASAKKGAVKDSAHGILESANVFVATNLKDGLKTNIKFTCENNKCTSSDGKKINFKGKVEHGTLIIDTKGNALVCVDDGDYYALKNVDDKDVTTGDGTCGEYQEANGEFVVHNLTSEKIQALEETVDTYKMAYGDEIAWKFNYTGNYQTFVAPKTGTYRVELWGAQAFDLFVEAEGGKGAYTAGTIHLEENTELYVYVGGAGQQGVTGGNVNGGWNGGGGSRRRSGQDICIQGGGGGATDIRITSGNWDNFDSLKSRIMVAAGGGSGSKGSNNSWTGPGGAGGGLEGYKGLTSGYENTYYGQGGTQTKGGAGIYNSAVNGYGEFGKGMMAAANTDAYTGGGGGWYGGGATRDCCGCSSGGGSSYISGHDGCKAIEETSTATAITHKNDSVHYSEMQFTDTVMIDGKGFAWTTTKAATANGMPTYDGKSTMEGNVGNGYAKITFISAD